MWGRKDEPEAQPASPPAINPAGGPAQELQRAAPAAAAARPASADRGARASAQVGKSIKFKGEISGSEDLVIDGEVEGTIELRDNSLIVGPNGNVRAQIKARAITVQGRLEGNVHAGERIEIRKTGSLEGDLVTPRIVIEDGAVFRGSIDILKPGAVQQRPAPSHKPMPGRAPIVTPTPPMPPAAEAAAAASPGQPPNRPEPQQQQRKSR